MSAQDNATTLGKSNQNLVLETAGRIYVKVQDRFYELDFRNQGRGSGDTKIEIINNSTSNQDIDMKGYVTKEFLKASLNSYVTKRSWNDVKETQSMLENAMLDGFTESINPITIQTMQVVVGSDQLQFEFVNDFTHAEEIAYGPNIYKNSIEFNDPGNGIYIKHYTLDGPTEVRPEDIENSEQLKMQYCRWRIAPNRFDLGDPSASYYIYIKVPRLQDNGSWINSSNPMTIYTKTNAESTSVYNQFGLGEFVLSNTAIEMASESGYYYLLYGMINSDDGTGRSFSTMNGFTEILPGQITAYIFKSASGDSYLDLRKNELKLGDAFQWNINNSHILYIKGAIVVDDGGNESYMYLDRGIFHRYRYENNNMYVETDDCTITGVEGNVYYQGNTVVWTNDKGITSTYMYIGPNEDNNDQPIHAYNTCDPDPITSEDPNYNPNVSYFDPTNENFWRVIAKGVRGYSNLIADLSNEMEAVACDKDGYVINEDGLVVTTQASLYYGSSEVELHSTESGSTIIFDGITIDTHEIDNLNPQPEDPNVPRNPAISYRILDTNPVSYSKIIEFTIPHGLKLPEKGEISITMKSKNQYGEEDDDTRPIVFTLVGVRSGKAYNLVPSARSIRRAANGLYDPASFECGVVCNGTSDSVDPNEIIVKRVFGNSVVINEGIVGEEIIIPDINAGFGNNLEAFINDSNLDWDWYTDGSNIDTIDTITFGDDTDFEKITLFLYYQDPLSFKWMLCDKETILIVKDGDPGKDFSITASSNVFMYETESSKVPTNSVITLRGIPKNIKTISYYTWQYRIPDVSQNWTYIDPNSQSLVYDPDHQHGWKIDSTNSSSYKADEMGRSTLTINGPIIENNVVNARDFNTYFYTTQNNTTIEHRMCEFQVTVYYTELGIATSLSDITSLHIIKGGDGSLTVYLPNSSMNFASTDKKGVSLNLAERTEVVAYYGLEKLTSLGSNRIDSVTITRYQYTDINGVIHIYDSNPEHSPISDYTNIVNAVKASYNSNDCSIIVSTGVNDNAASFMATSGEIDATITIYLTGKDPDTHVITRTIYWNTAKQGEIGIAKQPRGRSDWNVNGYPNGNGYEMYQGTQDTEDNWEGEWYNNAIPDPSQAWDETRNIFFDIVRVDNDTKKTYYCIKGGPGAASHKPGVTTGWEEYWTMMTYMNIASDVAWINDALVERLTTKVASIAQLKVKELHTEGIQQGNSTIYGNRTNIQDNIITISNARDDSIVNISSNNLPNVASSSTSSNTTQTQSGTFNVNHEQETIAIFRTSLITGNGGTLSIDPFNITITTNYVNNYQMYDNDGLQIELGLSPDTSFDNASIVDLQYDNSITSSHTIALRGGSFSINSNNYYRLLLRVTYGQGLNSISYTINPVTYRIFYPGSTQDGTFVAGNGFQTRWNGNGLRAASDGVKVFRNGSSYDVVGSNDIQTIFVSNSTPTNQSPDGLYFCY